MDPISDGCRLCLDRFVECFTTIDDPQLKDQMEKVFCFSIEPKQGYCSGVCHSCSYAISEFYQYSEKVRQNQEFLNGNCDPTIDSKDVLESVKVEMLSEFHLSDTIEDACELKDEVLKEEEVPALDPNITLGSFEITTLSYSGLPETTEDACEPNDEVLEYDDVSNSDDDESYEPLPKKLQKSCVTKTRQERNEEDQLFNKHFRMICDLCGTATVTFSELASHFRKKHKLQYGYVVCCNKKLFSRCNMLDHIDFHVNPDAVRCEVCGNKYKDKDSLKKHMTTQHSGKQRTMVCDTCGKTFLTKQYFERHMNQHMGIEVQRFQCKICQRWIKGEKNLRRHMNTVHTDGNQELQCDICLRKYRHSTALNKHKRQTHAEPKHECDFCSKTFKTALALKEHRSRHTGEAMYACEYCGKSNTRKQGLYLHIKKQHPLEWAQKPMVTKKSSPS